MKSGT